VFQNGLSISTLDSHFGSKSFQCPSKLFILLYLLSFELLQQYSHLLVPILHFCRRLVLALVPGEHLSQGEVLANATTNLATMSNRAVVTGKDVEGVLTRCRASLLLVAIAAGWQVRFDV